MKRAAQVDITRPAKQRCLGCNNVIDNTRTLLDTRKKRWDRLYCSKRCADRIAQRRKRSPDKVSGDIGPVPSVIRGTNGKLIATVARLGYVTDPVLDMTYGRGLWWTRYRPTHLIIPTEHDFRDMLAYESTYPTVVFDPPYISTGSRATSSVDDFYDRYGLGDLKGWRAIRTRMEEGLSEGARLLMPGGYLLMKCMDYVESGHKVWNTFHFAAHGKALDLELVDRFIHLTGGGAQTAFNLDGSPREQKHAREVSSMLLVFTK